MSTSNAWGVDGDHRFWVSDPGSGGMVQPRPSVEHPTFPAITANGFDVPGIKVRAASIRGLKHQDSGVVRQDDFVVGCPKGDGQVAAVVADGVSESPLSHKAAAQCTRWLFNELQESADSPSERDWTETSRRVAGRLMHVGRSELGREDASPRDVAGILSTTLSALVIQRSPDELGMTGVAVNLAGDSSSWLRRPAEPWRPILATVPNEGAPKRDVRPLPLATSVEKAQFDLQPGDIVALFTDGIGDALGDGGSPVASFLAESWKGGPVSLPVFIAQCSFLAKSHDDDRTAVVVWLTHDGG